MPKYYIKIDKDKYTLDSENKESAIYHILNNLKKTYSYNTTVYISEKGFYGNSWSCSKINSFLKNNK